MDIKNHGIKNVPKVNNKSIQQNEELLEDSSSLNEVNLNNDPAYFAGRAQVKPSKININPENFDPKLVASVEKSIDTVLSNPEFVKQSEIMFEGHFQNTQKGYERAMAVEGSFLEDFS